MLVESHSNYLSHLFKGSSVSILHHYGLTNLSSTLCSPLDENWFHIWHDYLANEVNIMIIMLCISMVILWAQGKGMYLHTCIVSASKVLCMLECSFVWHRIDVFQNPLLESIGGVILENLFGSWSLWPKSCHLWLLLPLLACLTNHKWNDSLKSINSYVSLYHISKSLSFFSK